ncbi:MAG: peptide-methionine (R)-S-oxide reductase MsrB [Burkholderiales bacterium]
MKRRGLLQGILASGLAAALPARAQKTLPADTKAVEALQRGWREPAPGVTVPAPDSRLDLTEAERRKRPSKMAYYVLREEGTEAAGTSALNNEPRAGIFACAGCGLPLFTSAMKYESHTGWPSFFTTIPGVFGTKTDYLLLLPRTEYHCVRCGGHHGHVFDDGPRPTGKRWCNNGVALKFLPKDAQA